MLGQSGHRAYIQGLSLHGCKVTEEGWLGLQLHGLIRKSVSNRCKIIRNALIFGACLLTRFNKVRPPNPFPCSLLVPHQLPIPLHPSFPSTSVNQFPTPPPHLHNISQMQSTPQTLTLGDIISLHTEVRDTPLLIDAQNYIPNVALLVPRNPLEPLSCFFRISRPKHINQDEYPNPDQPSTTTNNQTTTESREAISFDENIILVNCLSGKYLATKVAEGDNLTLLVSIEYTKECEFKIMPMFRCQGIGSKKVRQGEEVLLRSAAFKENQGIYNLSVFENSPFVSSMVKSDISSVTINKRGSFDSPDHLYFRKIYRIQNIQIDREILVDNRTIAFSQPANELETMFYLVCPNKLNSIAPMQQGASVYLRSVRHEQFVELRGGEFRITEKCGQGCEFRVSEYRDTSDHLLGKEAVLVLMQQESKRFFSFEFDREKGDFVSRPNVRFELKDTVQLVEVADSTLRDNVFVDQFKSLLEAFVDLERRGVKTLRHLGQLKEVLEQMLGFLFKQSRTVCQQKVKSFLDLQPLQPCPFLNSPLQPINQQINKLIYTMLQILSVDYRRCLTRIQALNSNSIANSLEKDEVSETKELNSQIIRVLFVLVVGLCKGNPKNVELMLGFQEWVFGNLEMDLGGVECLIQIFRHNRELLKLLQRKSDTTGQVTYLQILLTQIRKIPMRRMAMVIKVTKLLRCLVMASDSQPVQTNQTIIGQEFIKKNLDDILHCRLDSEEDELRVSLFQNPRESEEIGQMYKNKGMYGENLVLLENLLMLYGELCAGRNQPNSQFIRGKIPLRAVRRYIDSSVEGSLRNCFLNVLQRVYLDAFPRRVHHRNNVVCIEANNPRQRLTEVESPDHTTRLLNKDSSIQIQLKQVSHSPRAYETQLTAIKHQLLSNITHQLSHNTFNDSSSKILELLYTYLTFNMFTHEDSTDLEEALNQFIDSKAEVSLDQQERVCFATIRILHRFEQNLEEENLKSVVLQLLANPRKGGDLRGLLHGVIGRTNKAEQKKTLNLVSTLLRYCQEFRDTPTKSFMDKGLDLVRKRLSPRQILIRGLKSVLVIDDPSELKSFRKLQTSLSLQLEIQISKLTLGLIKADLSLLNETVRQLNQVFEHINLGFMEAQSSTKYQYITKELNIHKTILQFLAGSLPDLLPQILPHVEKVHKAAFKFLRLFIQNNKTTTKIVVRWVNQLKKYLTLKDIGQSHFFLMLVRMPEVKSKIEETIVPMVLQNMPGNFHLASILLQYCTNCAKENVPNVKFIDKMSKRILIDDQLLSSLLMLQKSKEGLELGLGERGVNGVVYYTQLFRFLNIILEYATDGKYLIETMRRHVSLSMILRAFQTNDIFEEKTPTSLVFTLLQEQLVKTFKFLKLSSTKLQKPHLPLLECFFDRSYNKVHFYNESSDNEKMQYLNDFKNNNSAELYDILLLTESFEENQDVFSRRMNFAFHLTNVLGPILGELLEKYLDNQTGELTEEAKRNALQIKGSFSKELKERVLAFLHRRDFEKSPNEYLKGIDRCEDAFKYKIKLSFDCSRQRKEDDIKDDSKTTLLNPRLELVLSLYLIGEAKGNKRQVGLYKNIFKIIHDSDSTTIIQEQRNHFSQSIMAVLNSRHNLGDVLSHMYITKLQQGNFDSISNRKSIRRQLQFLQLIVERTENRGAFAKMINNKVVDASIRWCSQPEIDVSIHCRVLDLLGRLMMARGNESQKANTECQERTMGILRQLEPDSEFFEKLRAVIVEQTVMHANLIFNEKGRSKAMSEEKLCYSGTRPNQQSLALVLTFLSSLIQGSNRQNKQYLGSNLGFLQILLNLLQTLVKFSLSFGTQNRAYYCVSIHLKISSLLECLLHFVDYQPQSNIQILIDKGFFTTLSDILSMNDTVKQQAVTCGKDQFDLLKELIQQCPSQEHKRYLRNVEAISISSLKAYKDLPRFTNPFIPSQANYLRPKTAAIRLLTQLLHIDNPQQQPLLFNTLSESILKSNITNIYSRHVITYGNSYEVFAFNNKQVVMDEPQVGSVQFGELVKRSNYVENGFLLVYILRATQSHRSLIDSKIEDIKKKTNNNDSLLQPLRELVDFSKDCGRLVQGCFKYCHTNQTKLQQTCTLDHALKFFLSHSGRVQILKNQTLHSIDFPILPECIRKKQLQKQYLQQVDLASTQSKSQSILTYSSKFILLYKNQEKYKIKYRTLPFIDLLLRHMNLFKNLNFLMIVTLNILFLLNSHDIITDNKSYLSFEGTFRKLIIVQMAISFSLLLFFLLKQMPFIILQVDQSIEIRRNTYGSNFNTYPWVVQIAIRVGMLVYQPELLYLLLFAGFVTVSYFEPVFVAILLLDIFFRVPLLRRILMSIWRPKIQIILALIAFILIEYYFSIILFFWFQDRVYGYCNQLQDCFNFVYFVTYKVVGGFPGFIFQFKEEGAANFEISAFTIFQDIYVIIVFEIFFAVLIGIIIDNFSILRSEEDERRHYLQNYCLICGVNKGVINEANAGTNFLKHIREDHNLWDYFCFFAYVEKKEERQRTELESYVGEGMRRKAAEWLPVNYMTHLEGKR